MLFSEPKIPQLTGTSDAYLYKNVSVLFSEPKIPQFFDNINWTGERRLFQCSSASRKFLNVPLLFSSSQHAPSFSALQRAENSSIHQRPTARTRRAAVSVLFSEPKIPQFGLRRLCLWLNLQFQCSSASRKFLNSSSALRKKESQTRFSALQRAENSSIAAMSEPQCVRQHSVSVLFSEPKIPQCSFGVGRERSNESFSALQRAENSSMSCRGSRPSRFSPFQCSSASRKFLNSRPTRHRSE